MTKTMASLVFKLDAESIGELLAYELDNFDLKKKVFFKNLLIRKK